MKEGVQVLEFPSAVRQSSSSFGRMIHFEAVFMVNRRLTKPFACLEGVS